MVINLRWQKLAKNKISVRGDVLDNSWLKKSARQYVSFSIFTYLKNKFLFIKTFIKALLEKKAP